MATSAVPLVGGVLTVSSGLINPYTQTAPTATQGQRDFQVIRVPQYVSATLTAGLTAAPFNGSAGGVLVFDVATALNLNGAAVSVSQGGFRGGLRPRPGSLSQPDHLRRALRRCSPDIRPPTGRLRRTSVTFCGAEVFVR